MENDNVEGCSCLGLIDEHHAAHHKHVDNVAQLVFVEDEVRFAHVLKHVVKGLHYNACS